jgi:hypothetical protein
LYAAAVYQATALSRRRTCCGFFVLVFGLVFLVFCFVSGGLLPLLEVAALGDQIYEGGMGDQIYEGRY